MVAAQIPHVHLEAMEEAPNEGSQLKEAGNSSGQGIPVGQLPIGLLANRRKSSFRMFHNQRKTRSSRIFQYPQLLRVLALMRLNRRVPVGTHGGVRGRPSYLFRGASYSIAVDFVQKICLCENRGKPCRVGILRTFQARNLCKIRRLLFA